MKKNGRQAMMAVHQEFVRHMLGPGKRERRYPTMEEQADVEIESAKLADQWRSDSDRYTIRKCANYGNAVWTGCTRCLGLCSPT